MIFVTLILKYTNRMLWYNTHILMQYTLTTIKMQLRIQLFRLIKENYKNNIPTNINKKKQ